MFELAKPVPTPTPSPLLIEIVGSGDGAPWWGVSAMSGAFLLLGALLGFGFNWLLEGRKAKAALRTHFLDQRLEYSTTLVAEARNAQEIIVRTRWPAKGSPRDADTSEALEKIKASSDEAGRTYATLSLIAPESLLGPARAVAASLLNARVKMLNYEKDVAYDGIGAALRLFQEAGRKHFGADSRGAKKGKKAKKPKTKEPATPTEKRPFMERFRRKK